MSQFVATLSGQVRGVRVEYCNGITHQEGLAGPALLKRPNKHSTAAKYAKVSVHALPGQIYDRRVKSSKG
jgi:hypothetical protein